MIKTWEDLVGKYVLQSELKVFGLFVGKCKELKITFSFGESADKHANNRSIEAVRVTEGGYLITCSENYFKRNGYTKLRVEDFQQVGDFIDTATKQPPKTKVEYIPVTESIFSLQEDFEQGNLYFSWCGSGKGFSYDKIVEENILLIRYEEKRLLRKVVTTLTWKDSLKEYLEQPSSAVSEIPSGFVSMSLFGGECDLSEEEFLEMCKIVVDANK